MTDKLTIEQRHKCMANIKGKDTKPEMLVRKYLFAKGYRFRLHMKNLPGKPDIVLRKFRTVIMINGCFWLIGLDKHWKTDIAMMAYHLRYLQKKYWRSCFSVNFPRMRPAAGGYQPNVVMTQKELAQLTFAFRIFDHDVDISYSTREQPRFRENMMKLGVTSMSAGSKTDPGGYSKDGATEQFHVSDERSPQEVTDDIRRLGYEPVWKDWDKVFD